MKIIRYQDTQGQPAWGLVEGGTAFAMMGSPFEPEHGRAAAVGDVEALTLLPPCTPSKIICVGRNYAAHAAEFGHDVPTEPLLFFKPPSAVIGSGAAIKLPEMSERVEHEAELALVIGKRCRDLTEEDALSAIFGFTNANDVTMRDVQRRENQWVRAKGFDTSCPLGPWLVTADEFDPSAVRVQCRVNGEVRQDSNTEVLIFDLTRLLCDISAVMTLEVGDVILTGTPEGVGPLEEGDVVEVEVEGLGVLRNPVSR